MATNTREKGKSARQNARQASPGARRSMSASPLARSRPVIDLIRGKKVDEALAILQFTPKAASPDRDKAA